MYIEMVSEFTNFSCSLAVRCYSPFLSIQECCDTCHRNSLALTATKTLGLYGAFQWMGVTLY